MMYSNLELFVNLVTIDIGKSTDILFKNPNNGWNGAMPGMNQDGRDYVLDTYESGAIPGRLKLIAKLPVINKIFQLLNYHP